MIEELLHAIGAPGWVIILASTGIGLYHFRHVLGIASVLASWLRMAGVGIALIVIATAGIIPGVDIDVQVHVQTLLDILEAAWRLASSLGGVI